MKRRVRLAVVDNFDSFTYNLVALVQQAGAEVTVLRNDDRRVLHAQADGLLLSPGPGSPKAAGYSAAALERFVATGRPVLGVCLGHQLIAELAGARVERATRPMHGKTCRLSHDQTGLYAELPQRAQVMRYHSLIVSEYKLPRSLSITARDADTGEIMGLAWLDDHGHRKAEGVQFHPESILTEGGADLMRAWVARVAETR